VIIAFASPQNAERNVAGLPAVARVVREVALAGVDACIVTASSDWRPSDWVAGEIERLRGAMKVMIADPGTVIGGANAISGEVLCAHQAYQLWPNVLRPMHEPDANYSTEAMLHLAERRIMLATQKPEDGIVSRTINRPVSRRISGLLLRCSWIRPFHATAMTALVAVVMFATLLTSDNKGLLFGALLFQAASILDGVDGEIARSTFRASRLGATADSLVDAATNVAFIGGVIINLWISGSKQEATIGAIGLALMSLGLLLLGLKARQSKGNFTFDFVKHEFSKRPSRLKKCLTWLTMRDFYALAGCVLVATGHAGAGLMAFAVVAVGWLAVVVVVINRKRAPALKDPFCLSQSAAAK
jgi:CDP-L-myo-inositol myo-inositolphosphotransferase